MMSLVEVRCESDPMNSHRTVPFRVDDERGRLCIATALVEHAVLSDNIARLIVQDREGQAQLLHCPGCLRQVVNADRQEFGVEVRDRLVIVLQLTELPTAVGSPETPVEHQHHVPVSGEGSQADGFSRRAGQSELGRDFTGGSGSSGLRRGRFAFRSRCRRGCRFSRCRWRFLRRLVGRPAGQQESSNQKRACHQKKETAIL